jgi:phage terminase small subunit
MPGPPPTPSYLKLLRGNPGRRHVPVEPAPAIEAQVPDPPAFVTGYAADEWGRVAPELHRVRLLRVTDITCFAAYCVAYGRWRTAEEALARFAAKDSLTSGLLIKSTDGNPRRNQWPRSRPMRRGT